MKLSIVLSAAAAIVGISAQSTCNTGFYPGTDTVIFTVPYTYAQVMSIIGDYGNLTWSGSPAGSVTLNGTDNTVGTARTYDIDGAHVVETITYYSKPANGPYNETHILALLTIPSAGLSASADYDGTTVTPICNGAASTFNFTINFCANNATLAQGVFHQVHLGDAMTVGKFLGGKNFTTCDALSNTSTTATTASTPAQVTGSSATVISTSFSNVILVTGVLVLLSCL